MCVEWHGGGVFDAIFTGFAFKPSKGECGNFQETLLDGTQVIGKGTTALKGFTLGFAIETEALKYGQLWHANLFGRRVTLEGNRQFYGITDIDIEGV